MRRHTLFLSVLLITSLLDPNVWPQCTPPASSSFPKLQDDVVGALPPGQRSRRLLKLFGQAQLAAKHPIRFTKLPSQVKNTSATENAATDPCDPLRSFPLIVERD